VSGAAVTAAIVVAAVTAAIASSARAEPDGSRPVLMSAVLTAAGSRDTPRGEFYARVGRYGDRAQLHFNFTYPPSRSGGFLWPYPGVAHIHLGRPAQPGRVVVDLCPGSTQCGLGFVWSESFPYELVGRMRIRGAFVELHPRNTGYVKLRGQLLFR
jgi:hypothetical protein